MRRRHNHGFTLIELLVCVAIVAVLTAIATMNYALASTCCRLVRVQCDIRTLRTGLECYRTDHHAYPCATEGAGDILLDNPLTPLTTPLAYLAVIPEDPFGLAHYDFAPELTQHGYLYKDRAGTSIGMTGETFRRMWEHMPGREYLLHSCGPDRVWDVMPYVEYDVTNGTFSPGDICRFGP